MTAIDLDQFSDRARYVRIAGGLRSRILSGAIAPGDRLPTTRAMALRLGVNRNTVVAAYNKLGEWGFARSHVGRGTFAADPGGGGDWQGPGERGTGAARTEARSPAPRLASLPAPGNAPSTVPAPTPSSGRSLRPSAAPSLTAFPASGSPTPWAGAFSRALEGRKVASLAAIYPPSAARRSIAFAGSFPAPDLLPAKAFFAALDRAWRSEKGKILAYAPASGLPSLRQWIAKEMTRGGIATEPDEVMITNGSQQAIDLIARAFVDQGDLVLIENPTYSGAISAFGSFGARLAGLPLDGEGVVPGAITRAASRSRAKLLYLTPSFQNPTTGVLTLARRHQLLQEASAANLLVVEDDWAGGLRFEGSDLPPLRALDREGRVIYLSTFAKKLIPGLRIGWIAAAHPVIERLAVLKQISDCCSSPLVQGAIEEFCRGGALEKHLALVRKAYRNRRDRMLAALEKHFPAQAVWTRPPGGLFVWVLLPDGVDAALVQAEAESRGVSVSLGDPFYLEGQGPPSLRLTFASTLPPEIDKGCRILGSILKKHPAGSSRRLAGARREAVPLV